MSNKQFIIPNSSAPGGAGGSGTVTSVTFTGDGTVLSSTPSSAVTTSGTLTAALATQSGNKVIASPSDGSSGLLLARTLVAADIPSLAASQITSGTLALAQGGTNADLSGTGGANRFLKQTSAGAAITVATLAAGDVPSGIVTWGLIGNAAGALTLANATNATTFNHTSAVIWTWANTTAATSGTSQSSPVITVAGRYWSGADALDSWTIQDVVANGTNGTSLLTFTHSGTTGQAALVAPAGAGGAPSLCVGTSATGLWQVGVTSLAAQVSATNNGAGTFTIYTGTGAQYNFANDASGNLVLSGNRSASNINIKGQITTNNGVAAVLLNNGSNFTATSGTQIIVQISGAQAVASGAVPFTGLLVQPTINQTVSASGNYTALKVNAIETALLGTANLLLDLQAGAAGGTSKFAINNSGICTQYFGIATVSQGHPAEYATSDLTAQGAAIGATTLYAVPASGQGMYRISMSATITTVDGAASVLGGTNGFQVIYTSPTDSVVKTTVAGNSVTSAANTTATAISDVLTVYAKASTNIQFTFDYTSTTPGQMKFEIHLKCEAL